MLRQSSVGRRRPSRFFPLVSFSLSPRTKPKLKCGTFRYFASSNNHKSEKGLYFPWRHEYAPLKRLQYGTSEFKSQGIILDAELNQPSWALDVITAIFYLGVPWYEIFFLDNFKKELAVNFSWAFIQGMAGILSKTHQVPFHKMSQGDYKLDFEYTTNQNASISEDESDVVLSNIDTMVHPKLQKVFQSAHDKLGINNNNEQFDVTLKSQVMGAHLASLAPIPMITRSILQNDPSYKDRYFEMDFLRLLRDESVAKHGYFESTIVGQVLVNCKETFSVKNKKTGEIVQGCDGNERNDIWHVVRLEMVIQSYPGQRNNIFGHEHKIGNWIITDIDDLLDGHRII